MTRRNAIGIGAAVFVFIALLLAFCGGSNDSGGDTTGIAVEDIEGGTSGASTSTGSPLPEPSIGAGETSAGPTAGSAGGTNSATTGSAASGGASGSTTGNTAGTSTGSNSSGTSTSSSGSAASASNTVTTSTTAGSTTGPLVKGSGFGYTADTINIGIQIVTDTGPGFEAVGASAVAPDEPGIAQTMVDWINENGGLAGRQVNMIEHGTSALTGTWASQAGAACETFTNDNEVVAVISSATGGSDALWNCLSDDGVPLVERNVWLFDDSYYTQRPDTLYMPFAMSPNRAYRYWIDGLQQLGYFDGATVGLLRFDGEPFDMITKDIVKPRIAFHGAEIKKEAIITTPPSVADFGPMAAELNNAIVSFRTPPNVVTHVIMVENAGIMPFFFTTQAAAQEYHPIYGWNSYDIPGTVAGQNPDEMIGSMGVSWTPSRDGVRNNNDTARDAREALCDEIYGSVGFHDGSMCDSFLFLREALARARSLDKAGIASAVRGMGTSYQSPMGVQTKFAGNHFYDAGAAYRLYKWVENCGTNSEGEAFGCFDYTTGPIAATR